MTLKDAMLEAERAILADDGERLKAAVSACPEILTARTPYAGATWLHFAAGEGMVDSLRALLEAGADVNQPGYQEGETALVRAADDNQVEAAKLLLDAGSHLDTSTPTRNPLFGAIVGGSIEVARLLLEHGIDAAVRYSENMDATAFAILHGQNEIARMIALHLAKGDQSLVNDLLVQAEAIAAPQGPLKPVRIIP